ncbi:MAG: penicillin-binding protein 1C [Castellaniella sp.]
MARRRGLWLGVWVSAAALFWLAIWPTPGLAQATGTPPGLPGFEQVRAAWHASDIRVLDRAGNELAAVRQDFQGRRGRWLALADISPALQKAVIQSEDRRFHTHAGVDWRALAVAGWEALVQGRPRGASTLSMQLAGMLDETLPQAGRRGLADKWHQVRQALALERHWSKSGILEAYLNLAPFRGELIGIDALSRHLFGKQAHGLDSRESALAAALLRAPNAGVAVLAQRACTLLREAGHAGDCDGLPAYTARLVALAKVRRAPAEVEAAPAPHFARLALARARAGASATPEADRLRTLVTTLDAGLQAQALASVNRHLGPLAAAGVADAAVVVLDNDSGAIRAYIGASGVWSQAPFVDHARAPRQAGSALKPFLYAMAIDQRYLNAASLLDNSRLGLDVGGALYVPQNYDRQTSGWASLRLALAASLNIPAVRTLVLTGVPPFVQTLRRLGLPLVHDPDFYGYSLALGSADVPLLALTNAYRTLANGGCYRPWQALPADLPAPSRGDEHGCTGDAVFSPQSAWIIGNILGDRQARAHTFGLDSALSTPFWSAAKTGTSKDMRDNWTLGWTRTHTVGVWVGNSSGASMREVSGVSGAGPIWHDIVRWLHREQAGMAPARPQGIVAHRVIFDGGVEPAREEFFLAGTDVSRVRLAGTGAGPTRARIAAPADGLVLALDPDIPAGVQQLALRASSAGPRSSDLVWMVDGERVGQGPRQWWHLRRGTHRIELRDGDGRMQDQATIHLR